MKYDEIQEKTSYTVINSRFHMYNRQNILKTDRKGDSPFCKRDSPLFNLLQYFFKEQACPKPQWGIVEPDDAIEVIFSAAVIPGAGMVPPKKASG